MVLRLSFALLAGFASVVHSCARSYVTSALGMKVPFDDLMRVFDGNATKNGLLEKWKFKIYMNWGGDFFDTVSADELEGLDLEMGSYQLVLKGENLLPLNSWAGPASYSNANFGDGCPNEVQLFGLGANHNDQVDERLLLGTVEFKVTPPGGINDDEEFPVKIRADMMDLKFFTFGKTQKNNEDMVRWYRTQEVVQLPLDMIEAELVSKTTDAPTASPTVGPTSSPTVPSACEGTLYDFSLDRKCEEFTGNVQVSGVQKLQVDLSKLKKITGRLIIKDNEVVTFVLLSNLETVTGGIVVRENLKLSVLDLPKLGSVGGKVDINYNSVLHTVKMPALRDMSMAEQSNIWLRSGECEFEPPLREGIVCRKGFLLGDGGSSGSALSLVAPTVALLLFGVHLF